MRDFFLALALLVVLFPILVTAAILIRVDSSGPVFFRQKRVGKDGRVFDLIKFRTFYENECRSHDCKPEHLAYRADDKRITRAGRVLRKTRLDEVPQLLNVLRNDMSLVGPRPKAVGVVDANRQLVRGYDKRHAVKPGITCLAPVYGFGDEIRNGARLGWLLDLYYIRKRSHWLDLKILMLTAAQVCRCAPKLPESVAYRYEPVPQGEMPYHEIAA